jgi:hypothetical protein
MDSLVRAEIFRTRKCIPLISPICSYPSGGFFSLLTIMTSTIDSTFTLKCACLKHNNFFLKAFWLVSVVCWMTENPSGGSSLSCRIWIDCMTCSGRPWDFDTQTYRVTRRPIHPSFQRSASDSLSCVLVIYNYAT